MTIEELREWDEKLPNTSVKITFKDGTTRTGTFKNIYPGDPNYPGSEVEVQRKDYFTLEKNGRFDPYNVDDIANIEVI